MDRKHEPVALVVATYGGVRVSGVGWVPWEKDMLLGGRSSGCDFTYMTLIFAAQDQRIGYWARKTLSAHAARCALRAVEKNHRVAGDIEL